MKPQHPSAVIRSEKPRVLVVDDNIDAANSLGRLLTLLGREVAVAHSGAAAVTEATRFRPRLILLDIGMPGMDGIEAAERIQSLADGHRPVLVALTGWGQDHERERTQAAGFAAHLVKPIQMDQLEAVLAKYAGPASEGVFHG